MRRASAAAAGHWPSARQFLSSATACGERAMASENVGASSASSAAGTTRQKLNRP